LVRVQPPPPKLQIPEWRPRVRWVANVITNNNRKMKNSSFAILAAATAIPVKPNSAATIATSKNISAQ
jgi:hypothetical protein